MDAIVFRRFFSRVDISRIPAIHPSTVDSGICPACVADRADKGSSHGTVHCSTYHEERQISEQMANTTHT